ncbi:hypothetical protein [Nostoc sp.]|uniref:hypothetical protein n=1 Tax=Nostoc sp. TaxID=1180 RepID=UPI002FFB60F7
MNYNAVVNSVVSGVSKITDFHSQIFSKDGANPATMSINKTWDLTPLSKAGQLPPECTRELHFQTF